MAERNYYYQIVGKNRYIPIVKYIRAECMFYAKNMFISDFGDKIEYGLRITSKRYKQESVTNPNNVS